MDYCDHQLLQLIEFGFPLDFNRNSQLSSGVNNHSSALDYKNDIMTYLTEEKQHGVIIGPFQTNPIPNAHVSPYLTRENPNTPN